MLSDLLLSDPVKPTVPRPSAEAAEQDLSRPQAEMAACDEDTEMDCNNDGKVCVPFSQLCDGQPQCPGGDDEDPRTCEYYNGNSTRRLSAC